MRAYLIYLRDRLRSSFWLVPTLMALGAVSAALFMLWVDARSWSATSFWWLGANPAGEDGARLVLSTIAGSMMTVASLVFSMTLVALTLAAGNIGPRLIDRFMDNRVNQIALGLFLATFIYSLLVLRSITGGDNPFIPHLAVSIAMIMALISFGWLIVFIHDLARSIQVDNVIAKVAGELAEGFRHLSKRGPEAVSVPGSDDIAGTPILAERSGYIQAIDHEKLLDLAIERDVVIYMRRLPGHFIVPSTVIAHVVGPADDKLGGDLRKSFVVGPTRTASQDNAFNIDLIVEIAARALSPGINDFYTALACVDHLAAALTAAIEHGLPGNGFQDETGRLRLVLHPIGFDNFLDTAMHPLRHAAKDSVLVTQRLLDCLAMLAEHSEDPVIQAALAGHGHLIREGASTQPFSDFDQKAIDRRHAKLLSILDDGTTAMAS